MIKSLHVNNQLTDQRSYCS